MVAIEFAMVFPVLLLMSIGIIELGLMMLLDASLEIAVREASRQGSMTTIVSNGAQREALVRATVNTLVSRWVPGTNAITVDINVYTNLNDIGRPTWIDGNTNGTCEANEGTCPPVGVKVVPGVGLAGALVVYTITVTRPGFTGILRLAGINDLTFRRRAVVVNE